MLKYSRELFANCLRIAIVPSWYEDERIESVRKFCLSHNFNNVMLFINAEEYNLGHMTIEEAKPWVETMKKAKRIFNANNISVSVNPWIEMGHLDRGRTWKDGQNFSGMVDMNGLSTKMVACIFDENWRRYLLSFIEYLVTEVQPDVYWIEDDFRLHNHGNLEFGGCFCQKHMKEYNKRLGSNYTRQEFVDKVFALGAATKERKAWLDVSRVGMSELAKLIGEKIASLGFDTSVALMSSAPSSHCLEARDWKNVLGSLSQGGEMINRIHLPAYAEISGKLYYHAFNSVSMVIRAFTPDEAKVLPELENGAFNTYTKDSRFLQFQVESAIPLVISGMTYDIFDFVGNGAIEKFGYGEALNKIYHYLNAIQQLDLKFSQHIGIIIPISEDTCYHKPFVNHWTNIAPGSSYSVGAFLSGIGVNIKYSKDKSFYNKTIFLASDTIVCFDDDELKLLFENNIVFLEGGSVLNLVDRKLGYLAGIASCMLIKADTDVQSYEQIAGDSLINGIGGYRASAQASLGDYVKVDYTTEPLTLTEMYSSKFEYVGKGIAKNNNVIVLPYVIERLLFEQFHDLRIDSVYKILNLIKNTPFLMSNYSGVNLYLFEQPTRYIMMAVNSTVNSFETLEFTTANLNNIKSVVEIDKNGDIVCDTCEIIDNKIVVMSRFEYLSTKTFILDKKI